MVEILNNQFSVTINELRNIAFLVKFGCFNFYQSFFFNSLKSEVVIYFSWSFNFFRFLHFFCCSHVFLTNFLCNYIWSKKPPTSPPVPVFPLQLLHYWTWTKTAPKKRRFYWSNPYKIEVVITSLIEMPELLNFGQMKTSII